MSFVKAKKNDIIIIGSNYEACEGCVLVMEHEWKKVATPFKSLVGDCGPNRHCPLSDSYPDNDYKILFRPDEATEIEVQLR